MRFPKPYHERDYTQPKGDHTMREAEDRPKRYRNHVSTDQLPDDQDRPLAKNDLDELSYKVDCYFVATFGIVVIIGIIVITALHR